MKFGEMEVHTSFDDEGGMIETEKKGGLLGAGSERFTVTDKNGGKIETEKTKDLFGTKSERFTITTEDEDAMGKFADAEAAKLADEKTGEGGEKFKRILKGITVGVILLVKVVSGVEVAEARQTRGIDLDTQKTSISMAGTQRKAIQLDNEATTIPIAGDKVTSGIKLAEAEQVRGIDLDTGDLTTEANFLSTKSQYDKKEAGLLAKIEERHAKIEEIEAHNDDLRHSIAQLQEKISQTKEKIQTGEGELENIQSEIDNVNEEYSSQQAKLTQIQKGISETRQKYIGEAIKSMKEQYDLDGQIRMLEKASGELEEQASQLSKINQSIKL